MHVLYRKHMQGTLSSALTCTCTHRDRAMITRVQINIPSMQWITCWLHFTFSYRILILSYSIILIVVPKNQSQKVLRCVADRPHTAQPSTFISRHNAFQSTKNWLSISPVSLITITSALHPVRWPLCETKIQTSRQSVSPRLFTEPEQESVDGRRLRTVCVRRVPPWRWPTCFCLSLSRCSAVGP